MSHYNGWHKKQALRTASWHVLHIDLKFHPYKLQIARERALVAIRFLSAYLSDNVFLDKLWISEEIHFHITSYVNKQQIVSRQTATITKFMNALYIVRWRYSVQFWYTGSSNLIFRRADPDPYVILQSFRASSLNNFPHLHESWFQ